MGTDAMKKDTMKKDCMSKDAMPTTLILTNIKPGNPAFREEL